MKGITINNNKLTADFDKLNFTELSEDSINYLKEVLGLTTTPPPNPNPNPNPSVFDFNLNGLKAAFTANWNPVASAHKYKLHLSLGD